VAAPTIGFQQIVAHNLSTLAVYGGGKPLCEGPRILPVTSLSFETIQRYELDYSNQMKVGRMSMIQSCYIDASNLGSGPGGLMVEFTTGMYIQASPQTQGFYPCLVQDPFRVVIQCGAGGLATIIFANFMIPPCVWHSTLVEPAP
jgi:hypothetical protein